MSDVLLLHAGIADSRMWEPQRTALERAGHRVLAPDLRGFGETPLEAGAFSYVEDARALLDAPAAVIGNSLGGRVSLELTLSYPDLVERLVLIGSGLPGWENSDELRADWAEEEAALERGDLDAAAESTVRTWIDGPRREPNDVDADVRALVREMTLRSYELQLPVWEDADEASLDPPAIERLGEVACPTLVIVGSEDVPDMHGIADLLAREIPEARKVVVEGAAHLPGLERPDEVNRLLLDFLR
jgi:pimeloyl-ACP methyl ester carboxylesterase